MIIGLTGSFGAGKGVVVEHLVNDCGFKHYSARDFIVEEIERRGLPVDRDSMTIVANDLRANNSPIYIIKTLFKRAQEMGGNAVIESLRALAEVRFIQEQGGLVLGVDADPRVRYERIVQRGSEKDHVSLAEWLEQEKRESNPNDPTKQDIFGALEESDVVIQNDNSIDNLYRHIDAIVAERQSVPKSS